MANVHFTNFALQSGNHAFSAIWKLTRALKKAGWTYLSSGDGVNNVANKDTTGVAANDKWGNSADPADDAYPTALDGAAAWWNAQGPTTLKVSMTSAPAGTFIRGEKVTQATTNAEGEFLGYDFDATGNQGHAVILPRTGAFNVSDVITGASSGATFTPTALKTFVMEIVFWKNTNTTQGTIFLQRACVEDELSSRFSSLAAQTDCTGSVAPGGGAGGTNNTFPTAGSYYGCGSSGGHSNWFQTATNLGKAQIVATNCTGASGTSPDGTFWILIGDTSSATQAQFFSYMRTDSGEDGDVDPFVWGKQTTVAWNNGNLRLDASGTNSLASSNLLSGEWTTTVTWRGWRRRGFTPNDSFVPLAAASLAFQFGSALLMDNTAVELVACSYSSKRVRDQILICSADGSKKIRKGYLRWMWTIMGGTTFDTWDGKTKLCILPATLGTYGTAPVIVGPYDGTTTPLQA